MDRVVFHIDVNSAFLSWEAVYRLHHLGGTVDLRNEVSAVGGDMSKRHGIILAKSIPAKKYNIQTGEPVTDALKKCPFLTLVPPNYELYEQSSHAFMDILRQYSNNVEQYSIDEAFVDMTGSKYLYGNPVVAARLIKDQIYSELGFTVNIGVSNNKLLAKMASDFKKPNRVHTLFPNEIERKMWPLSVRDLFFVGRATERKLNTMGIHTIGELAQSDLEIIKAHLGKQGETVWNFANGIDISEVVSTPPANKGYGNSTTIAFDVEDAETAKKVLLSLAESIGKRLRKDKVQIKCVSVSIRYYDLSWISHQKMLEQETNITLEIYRATCVLFDEMWNGVRIRHLGIHTDKVSDENDFRQLTLFDTEKNYDYEKQIKLDAAIDDIRSRFGKDSIMRAVFLDNTQIDHISGGISREKQTVDYSKEKVI